MFTGIIQHLGRILAAKPSAVGATLTMDVRGWSHRATHGESIAVDGCCLTVATPQYELARCSDLVHFDAIRHTLDVTNLGTLGPGAAVNLEHAVTPQTLLGGHLVQGHVDCTGPVLEVARSGANVRLRIQPDDQPAELMSCIVARGSIAVNGVSLTVSRTADRWFEVELIPTTLELTNLGALQQGGRVNLETDYVAKIVTNWLSRNSR